MGRRLNILTAIVMVAAVGTGYSAVTARAGDSGGPTVIAENSAAEIVFWESVKDTGNQEELELFLAAFPDGVFAALAKIRLNGLRSNEAGKDAAAEKSEAPARSVSRSKPASTIAKKGPPPPARLKSVGYVGLEFENVTASEKNAGIRITKIEDHGTASRTDLARNDVISQLNGSPVASTKHLIEAIRSREPGDSVQLTVIREGEARTVELLIGDWLELNWNAAQTGNADAMRHLAYAFRRGEVVKRDFGENREWLKRAGQAGSGKAYYTLGRQYYDGTGVAKNQKLAFSYVMKSAELDHPLGQFWAAYLYGLGAGVTKSDESAVHWYKLAAAQGIAPAMTNLGIRYQVGRGVKKDMRRAADWYEKAADAGHLNALSGLGYMYKYGKGGRSKDPAKAISMFRRAADKANASGTYNLGLMYLDGIGVLKDRKEALRLFRLAASKDKRAVKRLKKLGEPLYDLTEIQRLLSKKGFDPGPQDGKIGRKTREAISNYQRKAGLKASGNPSMDLVKSLRKSGSRIAASSGSTGGQAVEKTSTPSAGAEDLSDLATLD